MPIFEYRCLDCGKKFQLLVGVVAGSDRDPCPHCGSSRAEKLVSRFARYRNEDDRLDELADRMDVMGEPDSPSQAVELVREMGKAMDEDTSEELVEMFEDEN